MKDQKLLKLFRGVHEKIEKSSDEAKARAWTRLQLFMAFGFYMGMRAGEIARIRISDINLKENYLKIPITKTKRPRTIAISRDILPWLKAQMKEVGELSEFLFPQVHNLGAHQDQRVFDEDWQLLKDTVGIECRFHDLRHSCALRLKKAGVPRSVAAAYLGMSGRVYDDTYGQLDEEDTRDAAQIVRLHPVEQAVESSTDD